MASDLRQYYTYGEVYETLEACDELETLLGRLRRQTLLDDQAFALTKQLLAGIRTQVEASLPGDSPPLHG